MKISRRRVGALAILSLESLLVWAALTPSSSNPPTRIADLTTVVYQPRDDSNFLSGRFEGLKQDRSFYPYSVIPGGARNATELKDAVAHDSTVAQHYADFDLARTRVVILPAARAVFVSYRVGNGIFWTKSRLQLAAGETVLTDGEHMARTRCGNRISETPAQPVSPNAEPSPEAMEVPAESVLLARLESPASLPLGPAPPTDISVPPASPGTIFIPPFLPIFPLGGNSLLPGSPTATSPGSPTPTPVPPTGPMPPPTPPGTPSPTPPGTPGTPGTPPPGTPPIAAPEPASCLMVVAGLACVWLLRRKSLRNS